MSLHPAIKSLREAVAAYSEKDGVNALTISMIVEKCTGLIAAHWEHIRDAAMDEENKGKISLSFALTLDFTHKTPCGAAELRFVPKRVKDGATFQVEDPDQARMDFGDDQPRVIAGPIPADPDEEETGRRRRRALDTPDATA